MSDTKYNFVTPVELAALQKCWPGAQISSSSQKTFLGGEQIGEVSILVWHGASAVSAPLQAEIQAVLDAVAATPVIHYVPRTTFAQRLIAAGLADDAMAGLAANPAMQLLWWSSAGPIASDNAQMRTFLGTIGADPNVILAP